MPSTSAAQHRWIGYLHSDPQARERSGMSQAKVDEWLHADKGSPWRRADGGYTPDNPQISREDDAEILSHGRPQSRALDLNLTPPPAIRGAPPMMIPQSHLRTIPDMTKDQGIHPPAARRLQVAAGGGIACRDEGGGIDPSGSLGGIAPTSQTQNPLVQGQIQRYASLPTEKLMELGARMGGSPQSALIQKLVQQRHIAPQNAPEATAPIPGYAIGGIVSRVEGGNVPYGDPRWTPRYSVNELRGGGLHAAIQALQSDDDQKDLVDSLNYHGYHVPQVLRERGGAIKHRAIGGGMMSSSEASPWWTRREASSEDHGFLGGTTGGTADAIKTTAPGGSYVIPAEVIAGLGDGNSLAGARVMDAILGSGPHGTPMPRSSGVSRSVRPPPPFREEAAKGGAISIFPKRESGGATGTKVALSDGEYVVHPKHVKRIGGGDIKRGHRILDAWVMAQHKKHLAKLKDYKGPVRE